MKKTKQTGKLTLDRVKLRELTAGDELQRAVGGLFTLQWPPPPRWTQFGSCHNTDCCLELP